MAKLIRTTSTEATVHGQHERDLRALRLRALRGAGILFDFDNESSGIGGSDPVGGFLNVTTTTPAGKSSGGINFVDINEAWGGGDALTTQVLIDSITQGVQVLQTTASTNRPTGGLDVDVIGAIDLISEEKAIVILANGNPDGLVDIEAYKSIDLFASNGPVRIQGDYVRLNWNASGHLEVKNHAGTIVFRINDDGSIHGLASVGTITWDL